MTEPYVFNFAEFYNRPDERFAVMRLENSLGVGYIDHDGYVIETYDTFEQAEDHVSEILTAMAAGDDEEVDPEQAAAELARFHLTQTRARVQNTTCHGHVATVPTLNPYDEDDRTGSAQFHIFFVQPANQTGD